VIVSKDSSYVIRVVQTVIFNVLENNRGLKLARRPFASALKGKNAHSSYKINYCKRLLRQPMLAG
jgi:hypothetical protein